MQELSHCHKNQFTYESTRRLLRSPAKNNGLTATSCPQWLSLAACPKQQSVSGERVPASQQRGDTASYDARDRASSQTSDRWRSVCSQACMCTCKTSINSQALWLWPHARDADLARNRLSAEFLQYSWTPLPVLTGAADCSRCESHSVGLNKSNRRHVSVRGIASDGSTLLDDRRGKALAATGGKALAASGSRLRPRPAAVGVLHYGHIANTAIATCSNRTMWPAS